MDNQQHVQGWLAPRVPARRRIYAVGDIHGRNDLLRLLHAQIRADAASAGGACQLVVVYLGDYVDRGPGSFEVIDTLVNEPLTGFEQIFLRGNHEDMMLDFMAGPPDSLWLFNGGNATLESYGLPGAVFSTDRKLESLRRGLVEAMPASHRTFLQSLRLSHEEGDYLFVHAGVRPGRPLGQQEARDVMWIRGPFLNSQADFGRRIVHGHTITPEPDIRVNRIGIDTGAFFSGCLTCAVFEGASLRFLHT